MASFNKTILIGNLVEDPELKMTPSGIPVTSFRIAVGRRYAKAGEQSADFITIVCWRQTAEFVKNYFSKGKSILVCGQLQSRTWTDNNQNKRSTLEVVADEVSFVEKKTESTAPAETPYNAEPVFEELTDDESLPF